MSDGKNGFWDTEEELLENGREQSSTELSCSIALVEKYEDLLFRMGAMENVPCFKCGYDGPGYYQPSEHKCAKKHHELYVKL